MAIERGGPDIRFSMTKPEDQSEKLENEQRYIRYMDALNLTPDWLEGEILDVGSGRPARFGRYVNEHFPKCKVYSFDAWEEEEYELLPETEKVFKSDEEKSYPYLSNSKDKLISLGAFPYFMLMAPDADTQKQGLKHHLLEQLRIIREGGEIRFSMASKQDTGFAAAPLHQALANSVREVLEDLKSEGLLGFEIEPTNSPYGDCVIITKSKKSKIKVLS